MFQQVLISSHTHNKSLRVSFLIAQYIYTESKLNFMKSKPVLFFLQISCCGWTNKKKKCRTKIHPCDDDKKKVDDYWIADQKAHIFKNKNDLMKRCSRAIAEATTCFHVFLPFRYIYLPILNVEPLRWRTLAVIATVATIPVFIMKFKYNGQYALFIIEAFQVLIYCHIFL